MAIFIAYNMAHSTTTNVGAGTSYASGAKCAIQLDVPTTMRLQILEWGISFDATAASTGTANVELCQGTTASTMSTAHTNATVLAVGMDGAATSRLNYGTTSDTGYGNGSIASTTTELTFDKLYMNLTGSYMKMWPLGEQPMCDADSFVQLRVNTSATANAIAYIRFRELSA